MMDIARENTLAQGKAGWCNLVDGISEGKRYPVTGRAEPLLNLVSLALIAYSIWYALFGVANQHFNGAVFAGVLT
ncbi:MAG TPA: hypothetical protein VFF16_05275, partial [Telluria sp.]|nr:hypothetical protein [Telluria sp.]